MLQHVCLCPFLQALKAVGNWQRHACMLRMLTTPHAAAMICLVSCTLS